MKNKWPKRAPALLAAVALTASMFPTGALALEAERQDTAETVTAAVQQTPTPTIAVENVDTGNTATPETAAEPETQLQEETVEQEESAIQTAETAALQQEPEAETAVPALAAEPDSLGKVWLTEIFPNDFDNRNKSEYGTTDDRFEYIELINTADTPVNLTTDYELVYGTKADNAKPFAVQETDGSDVVLQPGEVTVVWNQRTNVKNPGTVEDFRSNYMVPDNVHIVISQYGKDWANTGYFGLRARATGTVCADYSYVNGTIDKNDGKDIADGLGVDLAILPYITYTLKVGEVSDSDSLVLSWNGRASNADATHASRLFVQNTATGAWDEAATADENGSMAVRVPVKDHVQDGTATVMVQCTADSALPDFSGVTDQAPAAAWDGTTIPRNYDFAFAWETDTQYYSEEFFQHYLNMNNWIVDNKDKLNIRYVIHTGDIVDDFDMPYEWENADEAMKILDDANMPYGVLAGNHDIAAGAMEYENYQKYFGAQRVQDQPTFGEAYKDNIGHYDLLTENGQDFIILYMSWDIYADEINWMNSVLQKYSDRKAILCFHTYTRVAYNSDGGLMDYYGQLVQDNVVAQNPNVIAVLNGHYHGASYETTVFDDDKDGVYDRTVYQICTDYQSGFEGGSGYIKMLYFDLDNNKIYINSYSPSLDDFNYYDNTSVTELGTESAASVAPDTAADGSALPKRINNNINTDILTLDVNFHTDPQTILTSYFGAYLDRGEEIGTADFTVAQDSSRTGTAALTWDGLQPGTAYAWYAQVTNTLGSIQQTAVQRFTTAAVPADVPPTPGNAPAEPDPGPNTGNATSTGNTGSTSTAAVSQGAAQTAGKGSTPAAATAAIPQTGDTMPIVAVVLLCLGSMTALGILTIYRRKRKED